MTAALSNLRFIGAEIERAPTAWDTSARRHWSSSRPLPPALAVLLAGPHDDGLVTQLARAGHHVELQLRTLYRRRAGRLPACRPPSRCTCGSIQNISGEYDPCWL